MSRDPLPRDEPAEILEDPPALDVPVPDHHVGVPTAPSTSPPEPPVVPPDSVLMDFWIQYRADIILIGLALVLAGFLIASI